MLSSLAAVTFAASSALAAPPVPAHQTAANQLSATSATDTLRARATGTAIRAVPSAPRLDGRLDEPMWALAPVMSDFTQRDPNEGQPATQRTEVRVLFTDDALYVGVRAFDSEPDRIAAQLTRRDADSPSDWIVVAVDSYHDRRTAFQFWVNPAGVKRDVYVFNDNEEDDSWDAVWEVSTTRDANGWTAEYRIPFSQLRFPRAETQSFGFNVARKINRLNETDMWRLIPRNASGQVSLYGDLEGIAGIRPPRRLEILPYSVGRAARTIAEQGNPFRTGSEASGSFGADLKYGVTSNLTLDATINPDFGQVEVDPAVVNLSAFESFFPERRPFFTEGVNIFRFPLGFGDGDGASEGLFYSRRIGRQPQGDADPRGGYAEGIDHTSILGAAKLSGKTPSGWTIGLLGALTAEERADVRDSSDTRFADVVEPRSQYFVGRLARDFRQGRTVVGLFGTAMSRNLPAGLDYLRSSAYTLGLNWSHRFAHDTYAFRGFAVGSDVRGSTAAITSTQRSSARYFQRPDNDYTELDTTLTALSGLAAQATIGKESGSWRWTTGLDTRSPGFEANDMGFMRNADYVNQFAWVQRRWTRPGKVFRRFNVNLNQWANWDYGGERTNLGGNVNSNFTLLNYWGGFFGFNRNQGGLATGALRGGPAIKSTGGTNGWAGFFSDERKALRTNTFGWYWRADEGGSWAASVSTDLSWRPSGRMDFSFSPNVNWNVDDWQYVDTRTALGADQYLFGEIRQTTLSMGLRGSMTFTPTLTLQLYAEPFYSAGRYPEFKRAADTRAARYADRFDVFTGSRAQRNADGDVLIDIDGNDTADVTLDNPDFSYVSFRSNVVLRWEYRPGSTVFVVWQQNRSGFSSDGRYRFGDATRNLLDTRPENVFVVKVNYWLSL
ncbi:MAG: DUF5916 domain-containing protein [Gemmatimonadota bacterium]